MKICQECGGGLFTKKQFFCHHCGNPLKNTLRRTTEQDAEILFEQKKTALDYAIRYCSDNDEAKGPVELAEKYFEFLTKNK